MVISIENNVRSEIAKDAAVTGPHTRISHLSRETNHQTDAEKFASDPDHRRCGSSHLLAPRSISAKVQLRLRAAGGVAR